MRKAEFETLVKEIGNVIASVASLETQIGALEESITSIRLTLSSLSLDEKATEINRILSTGQFQIDTAYREFRIQIEDNQKRFCNMINEFKGLVSIERASSIRKAKKVLEFLQESCEKPHPTT